METNNQFRNTGSALDHCRNCKCKLFVWEEDAALCGNCIIEFIEDTKIEFRVDNEQESHGR